MYKKAIRHLIPSFILMMFVAMILACTSSNEASLLMNGRGGYNAGGDSGADGAMLTDSIAGPLNDYAMN